MIHCNRVFCVAIVLSVLSVTVQASIQAEEPWQLRYKGGVSAERGDDLFHLHEAVVVLPWRYAFGRSGLQSTGWLRGEIFLQGAAGVLHGRDRSGAMVTLGPAVRFDTRFDPLKIEVGLGASHLFEDDYGEQDLGGHTHFSSFLGVRYELTRSVHLGYDFQHISNAGLDNENPGVDLHLFSLSYIF